MARKRNGLNIYLRKKDRRYEGRYTTIDDSTGVKKLRSIYGKTYKEVCDRLVKIKAGNVRSTKKSAMTFGEIIALWLKSIITRVKRSTYANYTTKIDAHIVSALGGIRYDFLTAERLNQFIADKAQSGRVKDKGALSERYVRDIAVLIKSVCKFAAKNYGLHNPAADINLPKLKKKEVKLLNKDEQFILEKTLLTAENLFHNGVLLSLFSGIRIGELSALTWKDINLTAKEICIRHTLQRIKSVDHNNTHKTELMITEPKSETSSRTIPLQDFMIPLLSKAKANDDCYILSGTTKPVEPRTIQNRFKKLLENAGLPSVNFHSLRHLFATNSLRCGFDIKTLSELLGHSSADITLKRYVHTSDERKRECMNKLTFAA